MQSKTFIKEQYKTCAVLFMIHVVGILSILRADFSYADDLGRILMGNRGWIKESRFLSQWLSVLLHTHTRISDISPVPQLLAAFLLALAGTILLYLFHGSRTLKPWLVAAVVPLGLNPYFLECLSYKFDAPYMALSIVFSILPFLFAEKKKKYTLLSIFSLLAMYMTYQASSGIYPMLALLLFFQRCNRNDARKEAYRFLLLSIASYAAATVLFRLLVPLSASWYPTETISVHSFLPDLAANYKLLFHQLQADFNPLWKGVILLILLGFLYKTQKETRQNHFLSFLETLLLLGLLFLTAYGIYIFLKEPLLAPRALYGYCVLITLLCVYSADRLASGFLLAWCFFIFSFTYGNALQAQKTFTERRLAVALSDLNQSHALSSSVKGLQIAGSIGKAVSIQNAQATYPILHRLVPDTIAEGWIWSEYILQNEIGQHTYTLHKDQLDLSSLSMQDLPIVSDTTFETIRANEAYILITFH